MALATEKPLSGCVCVSAQQTESVNTSHVLHRFYVFVHGMHFMCLFVNICLLAAFEIKTDLTPLVAIAIRKRKSRDSTLFVG